MNKDVELILAFRNGNDSAFSQLCEKYVLLLDSLSHKYFKMCADDQVDRDDFLQEGKIALHNAVLTYGIESQVVTFGAYAKACVRNGLVSYLRKCNAKKRRKNNCDITTAEEEVASERVVWREFEKQLNEQVDSILSPLENKVFKMLVLDMSIKEISDRLKKSEKSINNAIYRARKKLRETLN